MDQGIKPWATLYHWDLPHELKDKGGWTNRSILDWFSFYVDFCTKECDTKLCNWMVMNEPMSFIGLGYFTGQHAPGKIRLKKFLPSAHYATLCLAIGGRIVREIIFRSLYWNNVFLFSCKLLKIIF